MVVQEDQKRQVQQATDIVRLIGEDVALRAKGREFVALCPFHEDHKPSMTVAPHKQIFHCFVCGAGGDAFGWLMKYHKMSFPEALKHLAQRVGITLIRTEQRRAAQGSQGQDQPGAPGARQLIGKANVQALGFFQALLKHTEHGRMVRQYLHDRGISDDMVDAFQLGYAPDRWDGLVMMVRDKSWHGRAFELAGLLGERKTGEGHYDRFRHRLIFPICDSIGRPIAFGGRVLPGSTLTDGSRDEAKYLNTAETPLFNKSATLYGLHMAKRAIIASKTAVIVEGYTDVIAAHQVGASNVVATLGTALTSQHVNELRRFAEKVVLVFDADEAGKKAADRAVEMFLAGAVDVAIAVLPAGQDPADLLAAEDGLSQWRQAVDHAVDALDYQFQRVRGQLEATETLTGRERLIEQYLQKLAALGLGRLRMMRRSMVMRRLADLLGLSEAELTDHLGRLAPPPNRPPQAPMGAGTPYNEKNDVNNIDMDVVDSDLARRMNRFHTLERELIGALLRQPSLFEHSLSDGRPLREALLVEHMVTEPGRQLYERLLTCLHDRADLTLAALLSELAQDNQPELAALATTAEAEVEQRSEGDNERLEAILVAAADSILRYHKEQSYLKTRAELAQRSSATDAGTQSDPQHSDELLRQIEQYHKAHPSPIRIARISGS